MTDYEIRATLRGATAAKILTGWQGPHTDERSYCLNPRNGQAQELPLEYVTTYCRMLLESGVDPLYRASEPVR